MTGFRVLLAIIFVTISVYTVPVVLNHGLDLLPIFFGDMVKMGWPGQFNLDFFGFLILSAFWTAWRNHFSAAGMGLGVLALFFGAPFLTGYLLYLSFQHDGDILIMLTGEKRGKSN